ncbi:hypothetical protein TRICI_004419 [Trichomonascus ciferrii]|uniref:Myb-like domain-containing protein n=1 Tax=Trichomonascus ciferrii TaxID=44093 RepID=A0A642V0Z3_9ASCO|nr:hypothetical protein TRICI_004419 [Trichomonascus ciferrii]
MTDSVPDDDALLAFTAYSDADGAPPATTTASTNDNNDNDHHYSATTQPSTAESTASASGRSPVQRQGVGPPDDPTTVLPPPHHHTHAQHHQHQPQAQSLPLIQPYAQYYDAPAYHQHAPHAQQQHPLPLPSPPVSSSQHHHQPPSAQPQQQPFSYVPTTASTVPVHGGQTRSRFPRRRRTGSKRSLEEAIIESSIPTSTTFGSTPPQRQGPSIGLLTGFSGQSYSSPNNNVGPTLPLNLPEPPLASAAPANPNALQADAAPRPKKKSKYSGEQDAIILQMKKDGKSWSEIAEAANCGNSLAARNRYQVLIGQQGGGAVVWDSEDALSLKTLLEDGEKAKWDYIASELSRLRSKKITPKDCQNKIKALFDADPSGFGIVVGASASPYNTASSYFPPQYPAIPHPPTQYPYFQQQQPPPPHNAAASDLDLQQFAHDFMRR